MNSETAYIGLGSNLGDRKKYLTCAIDMLCNTAGVRVRSRSSLYETKPVGLAEQPDFLNCAVELETELEPYDLLKACMDIEQRLQRKRVIRWGPRTVDLDILLYGDMQIEQPDLTIPHPRMHEREFALLPLSEIAPRRVHPKLKTTIEELYKQILRSDGEISGIVKIEW
ncbi:MAG: 2-amino-4-hydroxy-6-hydroxymethyldihydropteridine diphosphokinase [Spirochaetaceae bacterium]|nr:2-amino-4-hydroxy-6-hydroxymethyldihydropteridine diphosphokinase [Spirochaetaceae bacterium]